MESSNSFLFAFHQVLIGIGKYLTSLNFVVHLLIYRAEMALRLCLTNLNLIQLFLAKKLFVYEYLLA
jgi:hypothetical protein